MARLHTAAVVGSIPAPPTRIQPLSFSRLDPYGKNTERRAPVNATAVVNGDEYMSGTGGSNVAIE